MKQPQGITILNLFRSAGEDGLTSEEVEQKLRIPRQSASSRVHELVRAGCLYERLLSRPNARGKHVPVYEIDPKGTDERYLAFMKGNRDRLRGPSEWDLNVLSAARAYRLTPNEANATRLLNMAKENF